MTFSLFVVYKYFYGLHYSMFLLSMEIRIPTCMTLVLRKFRLIFMLRCTVHPVLVGPCHHGMARPQVADRGTASDKEGSWE